MTEQDVSVGAASQDAADATVDMLAEAREAQWSALSFMGSDAIKIVSPAKVNLFLGIGKRRPDGYHEVLNVMHALALHDNIYMTCREPEDEAAFDGLTDGSAEGAEGFAFAGPDGNVAVHIDMADKTEMLAAPGTRQHPNVPTESNLAFRAIDALARKVGFDERRIVDIRIEKHIPMEAGLGGGSSDAAAALVGFAHFIGLSESGKTLHEVASGIGADVAFFLEGGCGLLTGIGDAFERRLDPMRHSLVLVKPDAGVSTAQCYAAFDKDPVPVPAELTARVDDANDAEQVPLFNNLAPAACSLVPELAEVAAWLSSQEGVLACVGMSDACEVLGDAAVGNASDNELLVPKVLLSGSGAATYAITASYADAARIAGEANARGWWARATSFSSLRALKV